MREALPLRAGCPYLPKVDSRRPAVALKKFGKSRGSEFYFCALECAQSRWMEGLPAQAILMLNRAFSADLIDHSQVLDEWPLPYEALAWILACHHEGDFIGNPRRHFQHLATRMVEPRKELRSARAWASWWITREVMPECDADLLQLETEQIREPSFEQIYSELQRTGLTDEAGLWSGVITRITPERWKEIHCRQ